MRQEFQPSKLEEERAPTGFRERLSHLIQDFRGSMEERFVVARDAASEFPSHEPPKSIRDMLLDARRNRARDFFDEKMAAEHPDQALVSMCRYMITELRPLVNSEAEFNDKQGERIWDRLNWLALKYKHLFEGSDSKPVNFEAFKEIDKELLLLATYINSCRLPELRYP